jgi:hypothetical protein
VSGTAQAAHHLDRIRIEKDLGDFGRRLGARFNAMRFSRQSAGT